MDAEVQQVGAAAGRRPAPVISAGVGQGLGLALALALALGLGLVGGRPPARPQERVVEPGAGGRAARRGRFGTVGAVSCRPGVKRLHE